MSDLELKCVTQARESDQIAKAPPALDTSATTTSPVLPNDIWRTRAVFMGHRPWSAAYAEAQLLIDKLVRPKGQRKAQTNASHQSIPLEFTTLLFPLDRKEQTIHVALIS